ncbi:ABC transporter ATP-binding protein [Comamonas sp.]|jgi:ABC-type cobalamin/Fe3+-siderophores transport system ATPase subunit|uniref:ABC transporter ATP-binding protein n=1 Tax=Comamonas sp. TaxID=34028 RepID=UPI0028987E22|nr:ABC transporter ATP-binding protein [Comamonas sp.]
MKPTHVNDQVDTIGDDALRGERLVLRYEQRLVVDGMDVAIPTGRVTVIVGPNACGKSTLLRALSRLLLPESGRVLLHGQDLHQLPTREVARRLGLLPQSSIAPPGICVADLVARGRIPHQSLLRQWTDADEAAVRQAMADARIEVIAERPMDELSGGQRQRVWLAMALAQQTPVLLLDEPTTYLDIAHQLEVLELCRHLNRKGGRTLVMVLHDLNQAARYADHLIAMRAGAVVAMGPPHDVLTPPLIKQVFGINALVIPDPVSATPLVVPIGATTERDPIML